MKNSPEFAVLPQRFIDIIDNGGLSWSARAVLIFVLHRSWREFTLNKLHDHGFGSPSEILLAVQSLHEIGYIDIVDERREGRRVVAQTFRLKWYIKLCDGERRPAPVEGGRS